MSDIDYIINLYKNGEIEKLEHLGEGTTADVFGWKNYAIKYFNYAPYAHDLTLNEMAEEEYQKLKNLQHLNFFPKPYFYFNDIMIVERIYGITLKEFLITENTNIKEIVSKIEDMAKQIIDAGYSPHDLHTENIMVTENGDLKIIDVGEFEITNAKEYWKDLGFMSAKSFGKELFNAYKNNKGGNLVSLLEYI